MTSLFDVGKSAIQAYRQSLAVTGQNIANLNTEGYVRREAELKEVGASQGGITSLSNQAGLGVRISNINRAFDEFLVHRKLTANSDFQKMDSYLKQLEKVEDLLLPAEADLGTQIGNFFRSLNDVSSSPSDLAARAVALEKGRSVASSFNSTFSLVTQLNDTTRGRAKDAVDGLNLLSKELSSVNSRILSSGQSGKSPNSLLDLRDRLVNDMSALTDVTVTYSDRNVAHVKIGSSGVGSSLVDGSAHTPLGLIDKGNSLQIVLRPGSTKTPTSQISSGMIAGLADAYKVVGAVTKQLNDLALEFATEVNKQHNLGVTIDGQNGSNMFSVATVDVVANPTNASDVDAELAITNVYALPQSKLEATYSSELNTWTLKGDELLTSIVGRSVLKGPGFDLTINGLPTDGNSFTISPSLNAASNIKFSLSRPQEIAAASPDLLTASNTNVSDATFEANRVAPHVYPDNKLVANTFTNSLSPIEATNFISDGLIATIPSGTSSIDLASFSTQSSAKFQVSNLALQNITQLGFGRTSSTDDGPHSFNVSYASAYPNDAAGGPWDNSLQVANALNSGLLLSSANKSLSELGITASGSGGSLTLTSNTGDFVSSGVNLPTLTTGVGTNIATVSAALAASEIQIITREGRHIAGAALSDSQRVEYLTVANGFDAEAIYDAQYLNLTEDAYRGLDMDVSFSGGMFNLDIGSNGSAPTLSGGTGTLPANPTTAYTMAVEASNGASYSIPVLASSSANIAATAINAVINNSGVVANASTSVELFDFQSDGVVTFDLEAANRNPINISANITSANISNLAKAINKFTSDTGISAAVAGDYSRLILTSPTGDDIAISNFSASSPQFKTRHVDRHGVALSTPVGTAAAAGAFFDSLSSTSVVTNALVAGPNVSTTTSAGSGASLSVARDTSGAYSVTIGSGGSGNYAVGELFTVKGTLVGGNTPTHDVVLTVSSVDGSGVITGVTAAGTAPGLSQAQTTVTPTATSGMGSGASFDITMTDGVATVAVNAVGNGYDVNDTITILGSVLGGTDGVNDMTLTVSTLASSSMVAMGVTVSGNRIDTARFSGQISLASSKGFSVNPGSGVQNASQDAGLNGVANISSNIIGDSKLVTFDVNEALESGGSGLDGLSAVTPSSSYTISVPSGDRDIAFTASLAAKDLNEITSANVNSKLVKALRDQAPLTSLSGGGVVTVAQVTAFSFARTEAVAPADDTVTLQINGTTIAVDLTDIDGAGNAASTDQHVTTAIVRAVNAANLKITAATTVSGSQYGVSLTADTVGEAFTVNQFVFNDLNQSATQDQFSLSQDIAANSLPADGTEVHLQFGDQLYALSMNAGEVVVSGPEASRVTAYFDSANRIQVFGGGSLSGAPIKLATDTKVAGNSLAAKSFGLNAATTRLAGQTVTLSSVMEDFKLTFDSTSVTVSLDASGNVTTTPSSVSGLTLRWETGTVNNTGRLIAEYNSDDNTLIINTPSNALGFKTADREVTIQGEAIKVYSTDKTAFEMTASASSIAGTRVQLDDLPLEDLLVFVTGTGARSVGIEYGVQQAVEDITKYEIRSVNDAGNTIEVWDADTGHSIATRIIGDDKITNFGAFDFQLNGTLSNDDKFTLIQNSSGTNDARNLQKIINLQNGNITGIQKRGFQDLFGSMIAEVGASVQSGKISVEIYDNNLTAAREAESEFAGVNLDTEAAALIEFQQAYQASARILSTARELFQSLMEVV